MNALPGSIQFNGCSLIGRTLMLFTDTISGTTFTMEPDDCKVENIVARAVNLRIENERKEVQFREASDALTNGLKDIIAAAQPAECPNCATLRRRIKLDGERYATQHKIDRRIIAGLRADIEAREMREEEEKTEEERIAECERC